MAKIFYIKEGSNYEMVIKPLIDTTGNTISVRAVNEDSSVDVNLANASGVEANTDVTLELFTRDLTPNDYYLEIFADYGANDQIVLNNGGSNTILKVEDMRSVT